MINIELVKRKYQRNATFYDFVTQAFYGVRKRAIAELSLRNGSTVLDLGCGTGLSFGLVESMIGPGGKIVGVELSPAMLEKAREKISTHHWDNITLIEQNAEAVSLEPASVDAVLSFYTHDIMSSSLAVGRAVQALRPGGIFVAAGSRLVEGSFRWLLNTITLAYANAAITRPLTVNPWIKLAEIIGQLQIQELLLGSAYIASGVKAT